MTIKITLEDLLDLVEAARDNGSPVMFSTRTTDNKRVLLVVATESRRKHRAKPTAPRAQTAPQGG